MAVVRKKQDDKYLKVLRELVTAGGGNRQCFDCGQKGPTYVNMTVGSFVCTRCSGVLRGLTPPHRVKSISMATFTQEEVEFLKTHGNDHCAKTWLGLWDPKRAVYQDHRELMVDKYERKRYYLEPASPLKSLTNAASLKSSSGDSSSGSSASAFGGHNDRNLQQQQQQQAGLALTSPTSQRTAQNGLHKVTLPSAISRPQHNANDNNNNKHSNGSQQQDAFMLHNKRTNEFDSNVDFVADFCSADIFDANLSNGASLVSPTSAMSLNGYAKIQPIQQLNGVRGNDTQKFQNNEATNNNNTENFADFDHAPIYNAAAEQKSFVAKPDYQFVRKSGLRRPSASNHAIRLKAGGGSYSEAESSEKNTDETAQMSKDANNNRDCLNTVNHVLFSQHNRELLMNDNLFDDDENFNFISSSTIFHEYPFQERDIPEKPIFPELGGNQASKLTPLAMAAHATALAVLGNSRAQAKEIPKETDKFNDGAYAQDQQAFQQNSSNNDPFDELFPKCMHASARECNKQSSSSVATSVAPSLFTSKTNPFETDGFPSYLACKSDTLFEGITVSSSSYMQSHTQQYQQQQFNSVASTCTLQPNDCNLLNFPSTNPFVSRLSHPFVASDVNSNFYSNSNSIHSCSHSPAGQFARSTRCSVNENANFDVNHGFYNSNGWHRPMTNGFNTLIANNNNNGISKSCNAPAEDRYAALKDLDEQLRESKTVAAVTASAHAIGNTITDSLGHQVNPNSASANPFKAQQQALANPFQAIQQPLHSSLHVLDQMSNVPQSHPQSAYYNFNNSFYANPMPSNRPNACGFGFGSMQQQMAATSGAFNNPFAAASVLKSNNPFL